MFVRDGIPFPGFDHAIPAFGPPDTVWGRYGQQYIYACPTCQRPAAPAITPAATAIEWDREPGPRIGERRDLGLKPLEAGTLERVARGILKLPERPLVVPLHRLTDPASRSARPVTDVLATLTSQRRDALVVQVGGNLGRVVADGRIHRHPPNKSWLIAEPLRTG